MSEKIFIGEKGNLEMVSGNDFSNEDELQKMFNDNPEVIPGKDFGLSDLMVVGRETTLSAGYIDLLAVTRSGDIVIIEFKNIGNTLGKREVVAQLLDYGASLWKNCSGYDEFDQAIARAYFRSKYCTEEKLKKKESLEVAAVDFYGFENSGLDESSDQGDGATEEDELRTFKENLERNLQYGSFVYVMVCPRIPETAKHIIEYLSVCAGMRIHGVELEYFKHGDLDIVFPKGITYQSPKRIPATSRKSSKRSNMSGDVFEERIRDWGESYWREVEQFMEEFASLGCRFKWNSTGVGIYVKLGERKSASLVYLDTEDEGIIHPLLPERLQEYVDGRDDLNFFTADVLADYRKRVEGFPRSFHEALGKTGQFSMCSGKTDIETFKRFLRMLVDFYRESILSQIED
jgi:hypothetical protein